MPCGDNVPVLAFLPAAIGHGVPNAIMWLLWLSIALLLLRYFQVSVFADVSWWWVAGAFAVSFVWFEFIERALGFERKKAMDEMDSARKARIKRALEKGTR